MKKAKDKKMDKKSVKKSLCEFVQVILRAILQNFSKLQTLWSMIDGVLKNKEKASKQDTYLEIL